MVVGSSCISFLCFFLYNKVLTFICMAGQATGATAARATATADEASHAANEHGHEHGLLLLLLLHPHPPAPALPLSLLRCPPSLPPAPVRHTAGKCKWTFLDHCNFFF